jgi:hypothetical protein
MANVPVAREQTGMKMVGIPLNDRRAALVVPLAMLLGSTGYALGVMLLAYDPSQTLLVGFRSLLLPPERAIWGFLVATQIAVWMLLLPPLLARVRGYEAELAENPVGVSTFLAGFGILLVLFLASHHTAPEALRYAVAAQRTKILVITVAGSAVMMLALLGVLSVGFRAARMLGTTDAAVAEVRQYLELKRDLGWFLMAAGILIGLATLTTGALHRVLAVLNPPELFTVNPTTILLYGAFGSVVIALAYVPAYVVANAAGRRIADAISPLPAGDAPSLIGWSKERHELEAVLDLKTSPWENLRSALALLYPLLGSAIALMLGIGR